jgi:hypothetical protein
MGDWGLDIKIEIIISKSYRFDASKKNKVPIGRMVQ